MSMKFQNRVFLPEDEEEVRRLIVLYQSIQSDQQQQQLDRRCLSASNIAIASSSNSFNLRESSSRGGRLEQRMSNKQMAGQHVHFGPLAPGRSPVMKRRQLPSPVPTNRTAKTV